MVGLAVSVVLGAIAICGLPPLNGFVSEWLLVQSMIHSPHSGQSLLALTMPPLQAAAILLPIILLLALFWHH